MNNECSEVAVSFRTLKLAIIEHWRRLVKTTIPRAAPEDLVILEDHMGEILDNLASILETGEIPNVEMGKAHGFHRAVLTKFTFQDVLKEYSLLRETIIDYHYP